MTRKRRSKLSPKEQDEFYGALGHTIKVARTDLGIDRKELADQAGISYSYLTAIENGQKQASSQVLVSVAEALGLRTHELLESAESRRDRNLNPPAGYPQWLTGTAQRRLPEPARSMGHAMPAAASSPDRPPPSNEQELERFVAELKRLAAGMSDSDRQLLLAMARKLTN